MAFERYITKLHICLITSNTKNCFEWLVFHSLHILGFAAACIKSS